MLRLRGLSMDEFELNDSPTQIGASDGERGPLINTISVKLRRGGVERRYEAIGVSQGRFVPWVNEAAQDIDSGKFEGGS